MNPDDILHKALDADSSVRATTMLELGHLKTPFAIAAFCYTSVAFRGSSSRAACAHQSRPPKAAPRLVAHRHLLPPLPALGILRHHP